MGIIAKAAPLVLAAALMTCSLAGCQAESSVGGYKINEAVLGQVAASKAEVPTLGEVLTDLQERGFTGARVEDGASLATMKFGEFMELYEAIERKVV